MKIAAKEASETLYWLILCERSESYKFDKQLRNDLEEITRILSKSIASSKTGIKNFLWFLGFAFSNLQIFKLIH
ncbi:four helix bundle protein [Arachidicoccus ginsenosidimutans]|uniref:four helix bundle protein n=1 Tax=Arachidicoccus sp. BS20 TaxID=1850526 RepID=UPI000ACEE6A3|nr:four helix bundle protein [Arachidicoccus sp. BS20]